MNATWFGRAASDLSVNLRASLVRLLSVALPRRRKKLRPVCLQLRRLVPAPPSAAPRTGTFRRTNTELIFRSGSGAAVLACRCTWFVEFPRKTSIFRVEP